jgi:Ricin-type beta-trefoil lectin domain-like
MPSVATIATKINGFLLDAPKLDKHEHIQIDSQTSPPSANQQWTIVSHSDVSSIPAGYVNIFAGDESSKHLCIDIPDSSTTERTLVQLYPADGPGGHANQQWKLIPVGTEGYVYIASALDNDLVLDVRGGEGTAGTKVEIYKRGDKKPNQMWILNPVT